MKFYLKHLIFTEKQGHWLVLLSLVLILTACTTPEQIPITETPEAVTSTPTVTFTPTPEAPTATPLPPVHLTVAQEDLAGVVVQFVHPWTGEMADEIAAAAAAFSLSNPWDIWVEAEAPGGEGIMLDYLQKRLSVGEMPGLVASDPASLAALDGHYFSVNLMDYYLHPEWGMDQQTRDDILDVFLAPFMQDGRLAALPVAPQATVLYINQTWAESLGVSMNPADETAFRETACAAAYANNADGDEENDGTGGWLVQYEPLTFASWYRAFGGSLPLDSTPVFNTPEGEAAFGYLKSGYDQGCFWAGRRPEPYFYFANRNAIMYAGTLQDIPVQTAWMAEMESADRWSVMGFPGLAGETMLVGGPGLVVTADTPANQMAAWLFAKYLLEPDVQADLARSGMTLPVRGSAAGQLDDLAALYPQWTQALALLDRAEAIPATAGWEVAQWVLEDALWRLFQFEPAQVPEALPEILNALDATINELEAMGP
jgi:multiple sugar transport system substrate-binding protein